MVKNPVVDSRELKVKLFKTEMSYENDYRRKSFFIERLQDSIVEEIIIAEKQTANFEEIKSFLKEILEEEENELLWEQKQKVKKKEVVKRLEEQLTQKMKITNRNEDSKRSLMRKYLLFNRQGYSKTFEEYANMLFKSCEHQISNKDIIAIFSATSLRKFEEFINWNEYTDKDILFLMIRRANQKVKEKNKIRERNFFKEGVKQEREDKVEANKS
ncbi:hypothetical protein M153_7660001120 [Pseudoloma neurophilia]|uniref:Uncharacterized protein n=1 Tax=Pseudoloma neurophilia TaxID=146866 RepID=A0A0R0LW08_9MICR|nr:hypothetical protein M153_7660001120 [Pseudoloma neurophilia]